MDEARFQLRAGTQDYEVFEEVVSHNQYHLPDSLPADSLILDIGANIGCFAVACFLRGAGTVVCFEPEKHNFAQLCDNLASWPGQAAAFNAAVWRSDREEKLFFIDGGANTACGCVSPTDAIKDDMVPVNSIGLDSVIQESTLDGARRVNILKIDAELAEYAILHTSKLLHLVDQIFVETHVIDEAIKIPRTWLRQFTKEETSHDGIAKLLTSQGFTVVSEPQSKDNSINTLHFATRIPEKS